MNVLQGVIEDIHFQVLSGGVIGPLAEVIFQDDLLYLKLPNIPTMIQRDIRIGDIVEFKEQDGKYSYSTILKDNRAIDTSAPLLPDVCPCCGHELTVEIKRRFVLRCNNQNCLKES